MDSPWTGLPLGCAGPQANIVRGSPPLYKKLKSLTLRIISTILAALSHVSLQKKYCGHQWGPPSWNWVQTWDPGTTSLDI